MTRNGSTPLVIFDCDGVLVDSEPISNRVMAKAITDAGLPMTADEVASAFQGMRLRDMQAEVERRLGRPVPAGWLEAFERERADAFVDELEPVDGIVELLRRVCAAGRPFCVASQASTGKMELTLGLTGLRTFFEANCIFSSTMVKRGKPAPDLFLHAAKAMGFDTDRCLVVEDGVAGAEGAKRAGMRCFGYAPTSTSRNALAATGAETFSSMRQLSRLLGLT